MSDVERVCAVCGRVLDVYGNRFGEWSWVHGLHTGENDHPAVPVLPKEIRPRYMCDFCYADEPAWVIPAHNFRLDMISTPIVERRSRGDWAACAECVTFVRANDWPGLAERVIASWNYLHVWPMNRQQRAALRHMYRELRRNITGPPYPHADRWVDEGEGRRSGCQ